MANDFPQAPSKRFAKGSIAQRGKNSWRVTISDRHERGESRLIHRTVRGTRQDAERVRNEMMIERGLPESLGSLPSPSDLSRCSPKMSWEYLAAFFDGEGCLSIKHINRKTDNAPVIWWMVSQKNRNNLCDLEEFLSSFVKITKDTNSVRVTNRQDVLFILSQTIPYLRVKRAFALECYSYLQKVEQLVTKYGQKYHLSVERPVPPLRITERR